MLPSWSCLFTAATAWRSSWDQMLAQHNSNLYVWVSDEILQLQTQNVGTKCIKMSSFRCWFSSSLEKCSTSQNHVAQLAWPAWWDFAGEALTTAWGLQQMLKICAWTLNSENLCSSLFLRIGLVLCEQSSTCEFPSAKEAYVPDKDFLGFGPGFPRNTCDPSWLLICPGGGPRSNIIRHRQQEGTRSSHSTAIGIGFPIGELALLCPESWKGRFSICCLSETRTTRSC